MFVLRTYQLPRKKRIPHFMCEKLKEAEKEVAIIEQFIERTCVAAQQNSRTYGRYNFHNTWINYLQMFALDTDGNLLSDWKHRNAMWASRFRYNEVLIGTLNNTDELDVQN